jgi:hypothetical protein
MSLQKGGKEVKFPFRPLKTKLGRKDNA